MNAHELADALQETEPYYPTDYKLFDNAATMLRQQADRIAELEKQTKPLSDEEIKEVWLKRPANTAEDVVRFARAIEERHGIK